MTLAEPALTPWAQLVVSWPEWHHRGGDARKARLSPYCRLHFTDRWLHMVGLGHTQWAVESTVPVYGVRYVLAILRCSLTKEDICILLWNVFVSVLSGWGEATYIITCSLRCLPERVTTTDKCFSELVPLLPMPFSLWPPGKSPWILPCLPLGTALKSPGSQVKHSSLPSWYPCTHQFSSVAQSCPTLWDLMNCSTAGLSIHYQLPEFTQTHAHWVGEYHSATACVPISSITL